MSCKIKRNPVTKEIEAVLAPNGEHSILFASINRIPSIPDKETAALV